MAGPLRAAGCALRRGAAGQAVPGEAIGEPHRAIAAVLRASADHRSTSNRRNGDRRVIPVHAVRWALGCPC